MKRFFMLSFLLSLLLFSCSFEPKTMVTVTLSQDCPWEQVTGRMMWYLLKYFDGNKVHTIYLEEGDRSITVEVSQGSPAFFVLVPLGTLSPYGGYWNPGDYSTILCYPEYGSFLSMVLDAAEARPLCAKTLNLKALLHKYPDLPSLDRKIFLEGLYDGTLDNLETPYSRLYQVPLEGILKGRWISSLSLSESFSIDSISKDNAIRLFPGVWYYFNVERGLMLTVVITEEGEYSTRLSTPPKWY